MNKNVSVLGLGAMGSRMTANLIKAGYAVTVWNRTPEAGKAIIAQGGKQASTPKEASAGASFVIAMVRDDEASRDVWLRRRAARWPDWKREQSQSRVQR